MKKKVRKKERIEFIYYFNMETHEAWKFNMNKVGSLFLLTFAPSLNYFINFCWIE